MMSMLAATGNVASHIGQGMIKSGVQSLSRPYLSQRGITKALNMSLEVLLAF